MNGQYGDIYNQLAFVAYLSEWRRNRPAKTTPRRRRLVDAIHRWRSESIAGKWQLLRFRTTSAAFRREDPATKQRAGQARGR